MLGLLLLLAAEAGARATLGELELAVCGCPGCDLREFVFGEPFSVTAYGNASADTFDALVVARDFLPSRLVLASTLEFNCSTSLGFLLNGSTVLSQLALAQLTPASCALDASSGAVVRPAPARR